MRDYRVEFQAENDTMFGFLKNMGERFGSTADYLRLLISDNMRTVEAFGGIDAWVESLNERQVCLPDEIPCFVYNPTTKLLTTYEYLEEDDEE
jgi:hypothetical protein